MRYRKILADHFGGLHLDPESLIYLEAGVRRKTLRAMQTADRVKLAGVIEILEEKANIREDAALQIIMHLGLLFSAANFEGRPKTDDNDKTE